MTIGNDPTVHYALNSQNVAQEGHLENNNFVPDVTYLTGPRGVEYRLDESTGQMRWYVYDGMGSVLAEIGEPDQNNNPIKCTRKYDVYGTVRSETGTPTGDQKFVGSLGHTTEPDTGGLIYMRARWMDPILGRFISEDPAFNGENWYAYCGDNPVSKKDATGKAEESVFDGDTLLLVQMAQDYVRNLGREGAASFLRDLAQVYRNEARSYLKKGGAEFGAATGESGLGGSLNVGGDLLYVEGERSLLRGTMLEMGAWIMDELAAVVEMGLDPTTIL